MRSAPEVGFPLDSPGAMCNDDDVSQPSAVECNDTSECLMSQGVFDNNKWSHTSFHSSRVQDEVANRHSLTHTFLFMRAASAVGQCSHFCRVAALGALLATLFDTCWQQCRFVTAKSTSEQVVPRVVQSSQPSTASNGGVGPRK